MDTSTLVIGILTGAVGTGYCVYGRRERLIVPTLSGIALCVYPYLLGGNTWLLVSVGIALAALPFLARA